MADDELVAIVRSTSYRPEAQRLARTLLLNRGLTSEDIEQWRDPNAQIGNPPWATEVSESRLLRRFRLRRWKMIIAFPALFIGAMLTTATWSCLPFVIVGAYSLLSCIFWRAPLRILLLRPFELRDHGHSVRLFASRYLRYWGHIYTLTDSQIKSWPVIPEIIKVLLLVTGCLGMLLLWHPRLSFNVACNEDVPILMDFLDRRVTRNVAWTFSLDKLFKVSCTIESWRLTVQHLINSADLIVIDLSNAGEGLAWEINELLFYGANEKTVFITKRDGVMVARSFMNSCGLAQDQSELFVYRDDGVAVRHEELKMALAGAVVQGLTIEWARPIDGQLGLP